MIEAMIEGLRVEYCPNKIGYCPVIKVVRKVVIPHGHCRVCMSGVFLLNLLWLNPLTLMCYFLKRTHLGGRGVGNEKAWEQSCKSVTTMGMVTLNLYFMTCGVVIASYVKNDVPVTTKNGTNLYSLIKPVFPQQRVDQIKSLKIFISIDFVINKHASLSLHTFRMLYGKSSFPIFHLILRFMHEAEFRG